ncbi:MAG TPA: 50S ribosomal protein L30 [Clostridiaceae bacterium]|nr:50S ribosomal protein L30 [Clostridiaceae bacterium]HOA32483.1 50S ribosomal protein L30 [Clostridia bacterium]
MMMLKITLVRSTTGSNKKQVATVRALGLRKTGSSVTHKDNPQIRGMIQKVNHLVKVEEI